VTKAALTSAIRSALLAATASAILASGGGPPAWGAPQAPQPPPAAAAPSPPERPPEFGAPPSTRPQPSSAAPSDDKPSDQAVSAPLPPERPRDLETLPPPVENRPVAKEEQVQPGPDDDGCADRLARLGVVAKPLSPIENGACGAARPYEVSGLPDGVTLSPPITLTCPAAEALAVWSRDVVSVAAQRELNAPAKRIAIGTSYECRSQNHQAGAKLSEHAFANGVDVAGFEFDRRSSVTVGQGGADTPEGRFAAAVRSGACRYFTTVLGPGANAEHADHLHLDLRARNHGYRICE
jgi:hypothetical protein